MSMSRWEALKQWTGKKWDKTKVWTLEKCKSKPVRWTVSALSGASLANAMHGFVPMEGAWLAFNIIATGTVFIVSARLTSHGLSSQEEAPQKTQALVKQTLQEALQDVVNQLNENINIQNHNTHLIVSQLTQALNRKLKKKSGTPRKKRLSESESHHELGLEPSLMHRSASNDNSKAPPRILSLQEDIRPLHAIQIHIPSNSSEEEIREEQDATTTDSSFTRCWERLRNKNTLRFFPTYGTELTHQSLPHQSDDMNDNVDIMNQETYQSDLEAGIKWEYYR